MGSLPVTAFTGRIEGIPVVLLRPDWGQSSIFRGGKIYGGNCSELEAYLFLSRLAPDALAAGLHACRCISSEHCLGKQHSDSMWPSQYACMRLRRVLWTHDVARCCPAA